MLPVPSTSYGLPTSSANQGRRSVGVASCSSRSGRQHQLTRRSRVGLVCNAGLVTAPLSGRQQLQLVSPGQLTSLSYDQFQDSIEFPIAFELVQGPLVRWTTPSAGNSPPTAILVHGILGNRKNMQSFARLLVQNFPAWQVLLVDLRCHGESASLPSRPVGDHNVSSAARDVLTLLRTLRLFPHVIMGHSFGGKVVMSMASQFGQKLPRPVQAWVLDSLPGDVRSGEADGKDHPARLIETLRSVQLPVTNRLKLIEDLRSTGFSDPIARWVATNLRPIAAGYNNELTWTFDLEGISDMFASYENDSMWPLLQAPPQGLKVDFVKAERSTFRWGGPDEQEIERLGHRVHLLPNSGHWVHTDNPLGLFNIIAPSFEHINDRLQHRAILQ